MRITEIVASNEFAAMLYGLKIDLRERYKDVEKLYKEIMSRKIPNFAYMNIPYFLKFKDYVAEFLSNTDIYPHDDDEDLINLIDAAHQMLTEIDNMILSMRRANLIK